MVVETNSGVGGMDKVRIESLRFGGIHGWRFPELDRGGSDLLV